VLEDGDESEIGEQGVSLYVKRFTEAVLMSYKINLSGGQKARGRTILLYKERIQSKCKLQVSLARAIYSRASTLLVDDVLSSGKRSCCVPLIKYVNIQL